MVLVKEFRIPLPLSVKEYEVGQLYTVAQVSKEETKGDTGVEILKNEPYENEHGKGQYTHKIYHLGSKVPKWLAMLAPSSALTLDEEAWNGYPYCKTVLKNPFLGERFHLTIISKHEPDAGTQENVHNLDAEHLKQRDVQFIDIAADKVEDKDYSEATDPTKFKSTKTGRGQLSPDWRKTPQDPIMCCYKLVIMKFKVLGLESRAESFVGKFQQYLFLTFHRKLFCYLDDWIDLTIADIRALEAKAKEELDKLNAERAKSLTEAEDGKKKKQHA